MKLLIMIAVWTMVLVLAGNKIKKLHWPVYGMCLALGLVSVGQPQWLSGTFFLNWVNQYVRQGAAAGALFVIVMYAILMPKGSKLQKVFMGLRAESAIMASFLLLPHTIFFGLQYGKILIRGSRILAVNEWIALSCSVVMFCLLVPLTVTSFPKIRKKMQPKKWKQLQRWSYLFYGLLYVHVAALTLPQAWNGVGSYRNTFFAYTIVYGVYAGLRLRKALIKKKQIRQGNTVMVTIFAVSLVFGGLCVWHSLTEQKNKVSLQQEASEAVTDALTEAENRYQDGTWVGSGIGFNGTITVEVTIEDGKLLSIKILESEDDEEYFTSAANGMKKRILEAQSAEVDAVSGATYSSNGIRDAVREALKQAEVYTITDLAMGTAVSAKVWGEDLTEEIMTCLHAWDERISWRIDTSEIAGWNQAAKKKKAYELSEPVAEYMTELLELCKQSDGAFDMTVGELVCLWNVEGENFVLPHAQEIEALLEHTGYEKITYEKQTFSMPKDWWIDLGAVGKGIGCSEAQKLLEAHEIPAATVSVGGSILTFGEKPDGSLWKIAVTNPRKEDGEAYGEAYLGVLSLEGTHAISTSGDYEKYVIYEGVRYHHILDPRTGYPADQNLISATIVCEEGWLSDALSTACFVMGYPECLTLLEYYEAEGVFVTEEKEVWITDGLQDAFTLLDESFVISELEAEPESVWSSDAE